MGIKHPNYLQHSEGASVNVIDRAAILGFFAMATQTNTIMQTIQARINYFPDNGHKLVFPGTAGHQRRPIDPRLVTITDIRGSQDNFQLERNGFQVVKGVWTPIKLCQTHEDIQATAYPECVELLKKL